MQLVTGRLSSRLSNLTEPWPRWRVATIPQTVYDRQCERCGERKGRPTVFQLLLNNQPWLGTAFGHRIRVCQSCRRWMRHAISNYRLEHEPIPF